jgi:hypothetical protein
MIDGQTRTAPTPPLSRASTIRDLRPTLLQRSVHGSPTPNSFESAYLLLSVLEIGMQGMGLVRVRYGPDRKSFAFKYGGMAYPGEGGDMYQSVNTGTRPQAPARF